MPSQLMNDRCDRCFRFMSARIVSYFEEKMICMQCLAAERQLLSVLRMKAVRLSGLSGCGYLPDPARFTRPVEG